LPLFGTGESIAANQRRRKGLARFAKRLSDANDPPKVTNHCRFGTMGETRPTARRSDMALDARLEELSEKHRALDRKIEEELGRPTADDLKIAEWKRQKLRLKDEIERLKHQMSH
jgi:hypothetical protein